MRNKNFQAFVFFLIMTSCSSVPAQKEPGLPPFFGNLASVRLGETKNVLFSSIGEPSGRSHQILGAQNFELFEYEDNGLPNGQILLSSEEKVIGVSKWIYNGAPEADCELLTKHYFPEANFVEYEACDRHYPAIVRLDVDHGIAIWLSNGRCGLAEVAEPKYIALLALEIPKKCPDLQRSKDSK